ncbi:hypothetical protein D046_3524, partial [Vibrio parahaemolyticus V-223/04]
PMYINSGLPRER